MLEPCAPGVFTTARPLRFFGLQVGTRMTVVRLVDGSLFVHSPVALDAELRAAVDALGPVAAIVAPNLFHHLYVAEWARAYPGASVSACPGLDRKRADIAWSRVLDDTPPSEWASCIDQVTFSALPMLNEVVFFHRPSKTIISSDFVFNLASHDSALTRTAALFMGNSAPGPTLLERIMLKDRGAAQEQVSRIVAWGAERIILAHGNIVPNQGSAVVRDGYRWLLR
jgi:hypothetical protein